MSKPTILILTIVYLASILIVGLFGMQVMSFNNINYIESITIKKEDIEFSNGNKQFVFQAEEINDGIPYMQYQIVFKNEDNLRISIKPIIVAKDPTLDPTNPTLSVSADKNAIVFQDNVFTVVDSTFGGTAPFIFNTQDSSNKKMVIKLYVY